MATKFALIPASMMDIHTRKNQNEAYSHLKSLDNKIRSVLDNHSLPEDQKYAQYSRILQMHDNVDRYNEDFERVTRHKPDFDYLDGIQQLYNQQPPTTVDQQPIARAYPQPPPRKRKVVPASPIIETDETRDSSRFGVLWTDDDVDEIRNQVNPGAEALVDALAEHLGTEIDYNDMQKKTGLRIGNRRFGNAKLENIINNLNDSNSHPGIAARQLARLLVENRDGDLIQNRVLRSEYLDTPKYARRKQAKHKSFSRSSNNSSFFGTPKAESTPQRGFGLLKNWIDTF